MASPRLEPPLLWNQGPGNVEGPVGMGGGVFMPTAPLLLGLTLGAYVAGRQDGARSRPASKKRSRSRSGLSLSIIACGEEECAPPGKRTPKDMTPRSGAQGQGADGAGQGGTPPAALLSDKGVKCEDVTRLLSATLKDSSADGSSVGAVLRRRVRFVTELGAQLDPTESEQMLEHGPPVALWMTGGDAAARAEEGGDSGWLDFTVPALHDMFDADWERNVHRHDVENVRACVAGAVRGRKVFQVEYRIKTSSRASTPGADPETPASSATTFDQETIAQFSGEDPMMYRWVQEYGRPRFSLEGRLIGYVGWQRDIHERKRQEVDHEIYWKLPHLALYRADTNGVFFKRVSPALPMMLGMTMEEFLGTPWMDLVHPDDQHPSIAQYKRLGEGTNVVDFMNRYMCRKDRPVPGPVYVDPVSGEHYKYLGWTACVYTGAVRDITSEVQAQEELARSKRELQRITDAVPGGVFRYCLCADGSATFPFVSQGILDVLGVDADRLMGHPALLTALMHPADAAALQDALAASRDTLQPLDVECRVRKAAEEEHRWVHIHALPQRMTPCAVEWCGVMTDRTARHQQEDALREAKTAAEKANTAKGAFLSNMSHEIRTPMNAVLGMAALLLDSPLSVDQREFASTIRSSGEALLGIINDILDYSKIEAGKMELEEVPLDLRDCIEDSLDLVTQQAVHKGLELVYHIHESVPDVLLGDVSRLRQILVNLLTNAVKFTAHGSVSVSVSARIITADDDEPASAQPPSPRPSAALPGVYEADAEGLLPSRSVSVNASGETTPASSSVPPSPKLRRRAASGSSTSGEFGAEGVRGAAEEYEGAGGEGCSRGGSVGGVYELHVVCQDTGIGIPADRSHALFQSFSQVDPSTTRKYGGTGLGLAICAKLCQLMGGKIWVESEVRQGSAFHFTVRVRALPAAQRRMLPDNVQEALEKKRVLLIAGIAHAGSTKMLEQLLRGWKMRPLPVETGADALDLMGRTEGQGFSLVIVDHRQVERRDPALMRCLQACHVERAIPLLLLNLHGRRAPEGLAAEGIEFTAQLNKPIKSSQLLNALVHVFAASAVQSLSKLRSSSLASYPADMGTQYPLRILAAEDNPINQRVLVRLLSRIGYSADCVGNGVEALEALQRQRYDVCLMDCFMPEMDGLEATRQIRKQIFPRPVIVAVTAAVLEEERKACTDAGMDLYIAKPLQMAELTKVLRKAWDAVH